MEDRQSSLSFINFYNSFVSLLALVLVLHFNGFDRSFTRFRRLLQLLNWKQGRVEGPRPELLDCSRQVRPLSTKLLSRLQNSDLMSVTVAITEKCVLSEG